MKLPSLLLQIRSYNQWILAAGFFLLAGGVFAVLIVDTTNWWNLALVLLGLLDLAVFLAANLAEVKAAGKKRSNLAKANLALVAAAMLGIVGGLNYVISRHPVRFDLTANKRFTLAEQTLDILKNLKQDVNVTMFISAKQSSQGIDEAKQLLEEYAKKSTKFRFKVIDADRDPTEAKRLGIHEYNTVVFESGDNRKDVLSRDYLTYALQGRQPTQRFQGEGAFTSALLKMSDTTRLVFYFTQGHGERDFNNPQGDGMNGFKDYMDKENYDLKTLNLLISGKIPDDAAVVAIVGPAKPFQPAEVDLLKQYLDKGGKLVICVDPFVKTGLEPILKDYGVKLGNDLVVDPVQHNFINAQELIPVYLGHPIVEKLSASNIGCLMPYSRSVQKETPVLKDVTQTIFLQTTDKGWGIVNVKAAKKKLEYHPGIDTKGPVPLAIACERPSADPNKKTRLVVYGNASFLTNSYFQAWGNLDVALNTFSWAAQEENKIAIHPKEDDVRMLNISNVTANLIKYLTIWILPLCVLIIGAVIWYRRRSL